MQLAQMERVLLVLVFAIGLLGLGACAESVDESIDCDEGYESVGVLVEGQEEDVDAAEETACVSSLDIDSALEQDDEEALYDCLAFRVKYTRYPKWGSKELILVVLEQRRPRLLRARVQRVLWDS